MRLGADKRAGYLPSSPQARSAYLHVMPGQRQASPVND
jgi:hypothetical protein